MSDANPTSIEDDPGDELQQALMAAFGEDALDLVSDVQNLADDDCELGDEIPPELLAAFGAEIQPESSLAPEIQAGLFGPEDDSDASPLMRYMRRLNRRIYSSQINANTAENTHRKHQSQLIIFAIGQHRFGLPLNEVCEVSRYPDVTFLPRTPAWLRGVANLRGQIMSVTDLRSLLQLKCQRPMVGEKVIVVRNQTNTTETAIVVDNVMGIHCPGDSPETTNETNLKQEWQQIWKAHFDSISVDMIVVDGQPAVLSNVDRLFEGTELCAFA